MLNLKTKLANEESKQKIYSCTPKAHKHANKTINYANVLRSRQFGMILSGENYHLNFNNWECKAFPCLRPGQTERSFEIKTLHFNFKL